MPKKQKDFINAKEMPLETWLSLLFDPPSEVTFVNYAFPSNEHREEYIASITKPLCTESA